MITPDKKTRKDFLAKLNTSYRFNILKDASFEEKYSFNLTPLRIITVAFLSLFLICVLFWCTVSYTSLRFFVPGYLQKETVNLDRQNRQKADSLQQLSASNDLYYKHLKTILSGGKVEEVTLDSLEKSAKASSLTFNVSDVDSAARVKINMENAVDIQRPSSKERFLEQELLFKPLEGVISSELDLKAGHFGIDVSAPVDSRVKSISAGTVIFSGFTANGGNEIHIQHSYNLISIYKHNSAVLKKVGEVVSAGESVAIVGDSGEHSEGTHLHFEMWQRGVPLNPLEFFTY